MVDLSNDLPYMIDRVDEAIIRALQDDGRLSNQALADRIGLSPSACLRRVRRLEDDGVLIGYRAIVDPHAVGRSQTVLVAITLQSQRV